MLASILKIQNLTEVLVRNRWTWHLGFWLLYIASRAIPYYFTVYYFMQYLPFMLLSEITFVVLVYVTLWLYRHYATSGALKKYLLLGLLLWTGYLCFIVSFQKFIMQDEPDIANAKWSGIFINSITKYFFTFLLLTMAKYFKDTFIQQYFESQQKQLQIQSELHNLKAQISPHFLFNTMNNFYGLAVAKSDKLPELMVRLSSLLRYSLYETKNTTVPLTQEITYLNDYIALEKIRLEDALDFSFVSEIPPHCNAEIAPLILVVFVENAFKHAKNIMEGVIQISISISLDEQNRFSFRVKNNCLKNNIPDPAKNGIGLTNVKKRLEVLYPNGAYQLETVLVDGTFSVYLQIQL
jgi:sensor histidine kinase YesM